jgi:hypothetical protein
MDRYATETILAIDHQNPPLEFARLYRRRATAGS